MTRSSASRPPPDARAWAEQVCDGMLVHARGGGPDAHLGTVDGLKRHQFIKLHKSDAGDGQRRFIPLAWVDHVDGHTVYLNQSADTVRREWLTKHDLPERTRERMYTVMNRIAVDAAHAPAFEQNFVRSFEALRGAPGLHRVSLLRPTQVGQPYVACMEWENEARFHAWMGSESYRAAHRPPEGAAQGMMGVAGVVERFESVAEQVASDMSH